MKLFVMAAVLSVAGFASAGFAEGPTSALQRHPLRRLRPMRKRLGMRWGRRLAGI